MEGWRAELRPVEEGKRRAELGAVRVRGGRTDGATGRGGRSLGRRPAPALVLETEPALVLELGAAAGGHGGGCARGGAGGGAREVARARRRSSIWGGFGVDLAKTAKSRVRKPLVPVLSNNRYQSIFQFCFSIFCFCIICEQTCYL